MKEVYLKKHPGAFWVDFGDFSWFRMDEITDIRFVGGFARAGSITSEEYKAASPDPISGFGGHIAAHMNDDHMDSTIAMVAKDIPGLDVSEAIITNPSIKRLQDDGSMKRPKSCLPEDRENPDWPEGYTYLDRFLDDMKKMNSGDVVFVAMSIGDYELMSYNMQELRRYIREVQEVVVYYRNVTIKNPDGSTSEGQAAVISKQ